MRAAGGRCPLGASLPEPLSCIIPPGDMGFTELVKQLVHMHGGRIVEPRHPEDWRMGDVKWGCKTPELVSSVFDWL